MKLPFVSVVMPVRNEAGFISRSLGSVLGQDYPSERMEVIVSDGMSTDGTRQILDRCAAVHGNLRVVDNPGRIVPTGLNLAVQRAQGDVIVRVDGHCEVERDHVRRCVEHLEREGVEGVGGPIETIGATPLARVIAVAMSSRFGVGGSAFRTVHDKTLLVDTIPFPAYTRAAIQRAGPYDEELVRNQDDEYNFRLRGLGMRLLLAHDVRSRYYSRGTLRKLARQYFQYGFWKVRVMQKHPRQMRWRHFVPAMFVLCLLLASAWSVLRPANWWSLALVAGAYMAASAAATACVLWQLRRSGALASAPWWAWALLPIAFATLHLSYGLGFLAGLARFWNRWTDQPSTAQWNPGQEDRLTCLHD